MQSSVDDIAARLKSRLDAAQDAGLVESVEIKGASRAPRSRAVPVAEPPKPSPLEGMDLALLSTMFWDAVGSWRGWDKAGCAVDTASKKQWGEALSPVLEKLLGELLAEYHAEATLLIVSLLIALPRERIAYVQRKRPAPTEPVPHDDVPPAFTDAKSRPQGVA